MFAATFHSVFLFSESLTALCRTPSIFPCLLNITVTKLLVVVNVCFYEKKSEEALSSSPHSGSGDSLRHSENSG